jgi:hypothetical protein
LDDDLDVVKELSEPLQGEAGFGVVKLAFGPARMTLGCRLFLAQVPALLFLDLALLSLSQSLDLRCGHGRHSFRWVGAG